MNVDPVPANVVEVHDLLTEALTLSGDGDAGLGWGLALFPRRGRVGAPVFGVVTRGGESTTLTYRMLQSLVDQPLWLSGRVAASVREARAFGPPRATPTGLMDQPVLHLILTIWAGPRPEEVNRTAPLESTLYAGDLKGPVLLLSRRRPAGWPP